MEHNIEMLEEEVKKLQEAHRQKMKEKRDAIKQRKVRTRRLIVHGAVAEGFIEDSECMDAETFQKACKTAFSEGNTTAPGTPQESCGSNPR